LDEFASEAWRQRRSAGALAAALGLDLLADGTPLTLEHYGIQKGSVLNVVRKVSAPSPSACCAEESQTLQPTTLPPAAPAHVTLLPAAAPAPVKLLPVTPVESGPVVSGGSSNGYSAGSAVQSGVAAA
ncbi:unnamed protein product, partial [Polarella glacialis]